MKDNSTAPSRWPHVAKRRHRGSARARARFPPASTTSDANEEQQPRRSDRPSAQDGRRPGARPIQERPSRPLRELGRLKAKSITRVTGIENQMIHGNAPFLSVPRPSRGTLQKCKQLKREIIIRLPQPPPPSERRALPRARSAERPAIHSRTFDTENDSNSEARPRPHIRHDDAGSQGSKHHLQQATDDLGPTPHETE